MGNAKFLQEMGHNRRQALGDIDQNIIGVTLNPFMVNEAEFKGEFAVQMVQQCHGKLCEAKKHTSLEDRTFIDAEECEDASDGGVPMFVKHTEDMLDEIDRMEEIEMEDVEDPVINGDSSDLKDPLAVVEYIEDIICLLPEN